jgi:FKBP-type peptidyl-prolyl cis-trans isomerase SlyD
MKETIEKNKLVELQYKVVDKKTGDIFTSIEYPVAYVHGVESVLSSQATDQLDGREVGDTIKLPINCDELYGPRDESLVFTDRIENVPKEYHEVGTTITMENAKGEPKNFIVTRFDDETLTVDGNNPLCGRDVVFMLEVLSIRNATDEEIALGGKVGADPDLDEILKNQPV